jgi:hypothetical protein
MGKRIIISESEKKNILSLYETTTVAPPPSESILVANKNPFKYPEFESARQVYSPELKDGDMFYILNNKNDDEKIKQEFYSSFFNGLRNKTVRYGDELYKFVGSFKKSNDGIGHMIVLSIGNSNYTPEMVKQLDNMDWSLEEMKTIKSDVKIINNQVYFVSFGNEWLTFPQINSLFNKEFASIEGKLKIYNLPENLPDEYFEIRKIQRQQTDF